ncbi:MAG: hypothetical protein H6867_01130 [Rhodospirillales bacterium]|nr:hypothetical protein [Rhodospirillales bacterium]MCB9997291.1 hypothetical protein [Rhodospirillales bacterium]
MSLQMDDPKSWPKSWDEKVSAADDLYWRVKLILQTVGAELPKTPRRPDVRLILDNISPHHRIFRNPAKHAGDKAEKIAPKGQDNGKGTAVMVMLQGKTLTEQFENAAKLVKRYNLDKEGLSEKFVQALESGEALDLVSEAYGPSDIQAQSDKLVELEWTHDNGQKEVIKPVKGAVCSYGARTAEKQLAFRTVFEQRVQGTRTIAELAQGEGMVVAVSQDWETKEESTRPIVPSVARDFYGEHYNAIPVVNVIAGTETITLVDLKNGQQIERAVDYVLKGNAPKIA